MGTRHPVVEYIHGVLEGTIPAGRLVRLAVERHLRDLEDGQGRGLRFDRQAAQHAIDFFGFLKHSKGEWAGEPFVLQGWQQFIVWCLFGWKRGDGFRRFRTAYVEVARKNGKSTFAAGIGLYMLVADGESGAEVYSAATKRDQAKITWGEAVRMVDKSPALGRMINHWKSSDTLSIEATASRYQPLGADADNMDGLNIHCAIVDELHAHKTRRVVDVLETATAARRQPLQLEITTAGSDQTSVCYERHDYTRKVLEGTIQDDAWFGFIASIDEGDDWKDAGTWAKANPNFGVTVKEDDLARKASRAAKLPGQQNAFKRLHLDVWTQQTDRWIDLDLWDENAGTVEAEELLGRLCYGGLDLSSVSDITAWLMVFPMDVGLGEEIPAWFPRRRIVEDAQGDRQEWLKWKEMFPEVKADLEDHVCVLARFWCPEARLFDDSNKYMDQYQAWARAGLLRVTPGDAVDYQFIKRDILEDATRFRLANLNVDRLFQGYQLSMELVDEGLEVFGMGQGFLSMAAPMKELERRLLGKKIHHGGNAVLRWMADNVAVRQDPAGNLKPDKAASQGKIDGIVGLVMALDRCMRHEQPGRSVYEDRGLLSV